ncbi:hypothetical protein J4421_06670 [Candidatus Woesearchaeota archaeon]|nr:hypothetical protein [Candidatus Woesearchaeota archaeon]
MANIFGKPSKKKQDTARITPATTIDGAEAIKNLEIQPALEKLRDYLRGTYKGAYAQLFESASLVIDRSPLANEELFVNLAIKLMKDYTSTKTSLQQQNAPSNPPSPDEYASFLRIIRRIAGETFPLLGQDPGFYSGLRLSEKSLDTLAESLQELIASDSKETQEVAMLMASEIPANPRASPKALHLVVLAALQTTKNTKPEDLAMLIKLKDIARKAGKRASLDETLDIVNKLRDALERLEKQH